VVVHVLVAYATRHGATQGIAGWIAETLARRGFEVTVRPAAQVGELSVYDAFVVGGAAYGGSWLSEASDFVRHRRHLLVDAPTWLFSSGPLGTGRIDDRGRDVLAIAEPKEFPEFRTTIRPRDTRVFFGAYDPTARPVGLLERVTRLIPAARSGLPAGDFRDRASVEAWARCIASSLAADAAREP